MHPHASAPHQFTRHQMHDVRMLNPQILSQIDRHIMRNSRRDLLLLSSRCIIHLLPLPRHTLHDQFRAHSANQYVIQHNQSLWRCLPDAQGDGQVSLGAPCRSIQTFLGTLTASANASATTNTSTRTGTQTFLLAGRNCNHGRRDNCKWSGPGERVVLVTDAFAFFSARLPLPLDAAASILQPRTHRK